MWKTETTTIRAPKNTKILKTATPDRYRNLEKSNERISSKLIKSEASLMFWKERAKYSFKVGAMAGFVFGGTIVAAIFGIFFQVFS